MNVKNHSRSGQLQLRAIFQLSEDVCLQELLANTLEWVYYSIKFTAEISDTNWAIFLDRVIYSGKRFRVQSILDIKTHFKPTEIFQYTHFSYSHSRREKWINKGRNTETTKNKLFWSNFWLRGHFSFKLIPAEEFGNIRENQYAVTEYCNNKVINWPSWIFGFKQGNAGHLTYRQKNNAFPPLWNKVYTSGLEKALDKCLCAIWGPLLTKKYVSRCFSFSQTKHRTNLMTQQDIFTKLPYFCLIPLFSLVLCFS